MPQTEKEKISVVYTLFVVSPIWSGSFVMGPCLVK